MVFCQHFKKFCKNKIYGFLNKCRELLRYIWFFTKCQKRPQKFQTDDGNLEFAEGIFRAIPSCVSVINIKMFPDRCLCPVSHAKKHLSLRHFWLTSFLGKSHFNDLTHLRGMKEEGNDAHPRQNRM